MSEVCEAPNYSVLLLPPPPQPNVFALLRALISRRGLRVRLETLSHLYITRAESKIQFRRGWSAGA